MSATTPNIDIRTIHEAEIQYFWTDSHLHDLDYHFKVFDAVDAEVSKICEASDTLYHDTSYCCQFEGVMISGTSLKDVKDAAKQLARVISRFKFIRFI